MVIEHTAIPDNGLHTIKGAASASAGEVPIANGLGSFGWGPIPSGLTNVVYVQTEDDFPESSAGVITLQGNTTYVIAGNIVTSNRFVPQQGTALFSFNFLRPTLTYTGSGTMFTSVDASWVIQGLRLRAENGTVFDVSDTVSGTSTFFMTNNQIEDCAAYGHFDDLLSIVINTSTCLNCDQGIDISGANYLITSLSKVGIIGTGASWVGVDLEGSIHKNIELENLFISNPTAGATGIKGVASNGNIAAGNVGTIAFCTLDVTNPLSLITIDDYRWDFRGNTNIRDSMPDAMISIINNATATTIGGAGTAVKAAGTFVVERQSHFTGATTNRVTYNGERTIVTPVDISCTLEPSSGTNKQITVYLAKNGAVISNSRKSTFVNSGSRQFLNVIWQLELAQNDYLEIWVANETDTTSVIVRAAVLRVR